MRSVEAGESMRDGCKRVLSVLLLAGQGMLAHAARDTIGEIEALGADHPVHLLESARLQLSDAQSKGDRSGQLAALRRLAVANRQLDDYTLANSQSEQGKALAAELHDAQALVH